MEKVNEIIERCKEELQQELGREVSIWYATSDNFDYLTSLKDIIIRTCNVSEAAFFGKRRAKELVDARKLFTYFVRIKTSATIMDISRFLKKDHTSIIYYEKQVDDMLCIKDEFYTTKIREIEASLKNIAA